ncbi:MAG: TonB-dependent receptor [Gemmatimonadetes bacterium]|nr:TonB-dependent receptor [Gemmatimonadota bacterium]
MRLHRERYIVTVFALALLWARPALAQTGSIVGSVRDAEAVAPLASARVEAINAAGSVAGSAFTDEAGQFQITRLAPGTYALAVTLVGFETYRVPGVRVAADQATTVSADLVSLAYRLNPIVVTASRKQEKALDAPATVSVVDTRTIESRPVVTPVEHLRGTPGVDVITQGLQGTNVVVRGFNNIFSGALHMLSDNRIAHVPSLRVNVMRFIPVTNEDIERMEIVLGPGSALYGPNTANGVLHIISKSPLDHQGSSVSVGGGNQGVLQGTFRTSQLMGEKFGYKVSAQYLEGKEWAFTDPVEQVAHETAAKTNPNTRIGVRDRDIRRWAVDLRADWQPSDDFRSSFSFGSTTEDNGIELTGIGAAQVRGWTYSYYQARANYKRLFGQVYLNTSSAGETYLLRDGADIVDDSKVLVGQLQHGLGLGARQNFTYGVDFIRTMPDTRGTITGINEEDDNYSEFGAYLQSETRLTSMFDLVLAGRYDKHSELVDAVFSPRAALVFKPVENHNFRVTYNRAFSTPTSNNLFLDISAGPAGALGPLGFFAHARGPGRNGFELARDDGSIYGIRSPFAAGVGKTSADIVAPDAASTYLLQVTALAAVQAARGQPLSPQLVAYMRSLAPEAAARVSQSLLNTTTRQLSPLKGTVFEDVPGIEESTTTTFEVGYKGLLGGKLLFAADAWWAEHENFTSPLLVHTPMLLMTPTELVPYLVPRLMQAGLSQAQATALATGMAQIPAGVVASPDVVTAAPSLIATYRNFGAVDLTGADLSVTALLTDRWSLGLTGSLVSDDHFFESLSDPDKDCEGKLADVDCQLVGLNAPKKKGTVTLGYRDDDRGFNGEVRVRYTDEFPVNSAPFIGIKCVVPGGEGSCVKSYTLLDLNLGYRLPFLRGPTVQLSVQNLLDEKYQSFLGVPEIGTLALLRLKYNF